MISFNNLGNLGRLANQMFQYASLKGIAANRGFDYILPPKEEFGKRDTNVRMDAGNSIYDVFGFFDRERFRNLKYGITPQNIVPESTHNFNKELFDECPDDVDLFGYYQTPKYFENISDEIKEDFTFSLEFEAIFAEVKEEYKLTDELISLHIRRGDYVNNPNHPVQPMEYYEKALDMLPKDINVIIFSDDPYWCQEQELFKGDRYMISADNAADFDMFFMTKCKYHIIANSSFSWWGAWLGNSDKIIAPKDWFSAECVYKDVQDMEFGNWSWL